MSRYSDYDNDGEYAVLDYGRWERNARAALKGRRGRKALAEIREALLALPDKRLIDSAVCTVGGTDRRVPSMTDAEFDALVAQTAENSAYAAVNPDWPRQYAEMSRKGREEERERFARIVEREGEGVCAIGAYLWHQKVKAGMDPAQAFAAVPSVFDGEEDIGDALNETAKLGEAAGLAYTLAWELAYRNDETYSGKTPEERYTAFLAWIDAELSNA